MKHACLGAGTQSLHKQKAEIPLASAINRFKTRFSMRSTYGVGAIARMIHPSMRTCPSRSVPHFRSVLACLRWPGNGAFYYRTLESQ
jgi:hypothetical protein